MGNICICGCDQCAFLFQIYHKPSNISFAVGSLCIKKFIPESSSHLSKIKKNELCVLCNVPLYFKKIKGRIKMLIKINIQDIYVRQTDDGDVLYCLKCKEEILNTEAEFERLVKVYNIGKGYM